MGVLVYNLTISVPWAEEQMYSGKESKTSKAKASACQNTAGFVFLA